MRARRWPRSRLFQPKGVQTMERIASKFLRKRDVARSAVVLLTLGVLPVGLLACGSDPSSDTKKSSAPVAKKEAGTKQVQLELVNKTDSYLRDVKLCSSYPYSED